jgi:hypothetical protein
MTTPAAPAGSRPPCGFCATGHHFLCPVTIRNGSAAQNPVWSCPCAELDHTLGGPHRVVDIERAAPRPLAPPRSAANSPGGTEVPPASRRSASKAEWPAGVVAPIAFRNLIVSERLVPETFRPQKVYQWITAAGRGGTFPVVFVDTPKGQRPGVQVTPALDWVRANA